MSCRHDDDDWTWRSLLYLGGWVALWLLAAVLMLSCIFGCMIYYW